MQNRRKLTAIEAIEDCICMLVEASYEDADITEEEAAAARARFERAIRYIVRTEIERFMYEEKQIQINAQPQHNA